jgi:hypothetical protein
MRTVRLTVEIQVADHGRAAGARHMPATQEDADALSAMRLGGQDVVAAALLGEAIRRDALLRVGIVAATDPGRAALVRTGDTAELAGMVTSILESVEAVARQAAPIAVAEASRVLRGAV